MTLKWDSSLNKLELIFYPLYFSGGSLGFSDFFRSFNLFLMSFECFKSKVFILESF